MIILCIVSLHVKVSILRYAENALSLVWGGVRPIKFYILIHLSSHFYVGGWYIKKRCGHKAMKVEAVELTFSLCGLISIGCM